MIRVAIDSYPLSRSLLTSSDYSGIQLFSLVDLSLKGLIDSSRCKTVSIDKIVFDLSDLIWSNGTAISGRHFINGIKLYCDLNLIFKKYFLHLFVDVSFDKNNLVFTCRYDPLVCLELLSIPNLIPIDSTSNERLFSGEFKLIDRRFNSFKLVPNNNKTQEGMIVSVIKSPIRNIYEFLKGHISVSSDTAFPAQMLDRFKMHKDYRTCHSGLYAFLKLSDEFEKKLGPERIKVLKEYVSYFTADEIDKTIWQRTMNFSGEINYDNLGKNYPSSRLDGGLRMLATDLVYDDYYPNKLVCELLKVHLETNLGLECKLYRRNYYALRNSKDFDISFEISYFNSSSKIVRYFLMEYLATDKEKYEGLLRAGLTTKFDRKACSDLEHEIMEFSSFILLYKVKSHYLSILENNPLLNSFRTIDANQIL